MNPQKPADEKSKDRDRQSHWTADFGMTHLVNKVGGVHAHERKQRAEVESLRADFVGSAAQPCREELEHCRSHQCQCADEQNVVTRNPPPWLDGGEKATWQCVASAHSVE